MASAALSQIAPGSTSNIVSRSVEYDGVPYTIEDMRRMIRTSLNREGTAPIRRLVEEITAQVRPKDYVSEVAAIYYWCLKNIRYMRDPVHVEYVQSPHVLLSPSPADRAAGRRAGQDDCEALATTIAAMCMSVGNPCQFVTISMDGGGFHHVFAVSRIRNGVKVVLDPVPGPEVSTMLRRTVRHQVWPIEPVRVDGRLGFDVPSKPSYEGMGAPDFGGMVRL